MSFGLGPKVKIFAVPNHLTQTKVASATDPLFWEGLPLLCFSLLFLVFLGLVLFWFTPRLLSVLLAFKSWSVHSHLLVFESPTQAHLISKHLIIA